MEPHDLNRMFDALAPSSEQAEACLNRLLQTERKDSPMKKIKKLPVIFVAAVLMVCAAAAAVAVTGIDQRIAAYFGAGEEQAELLVPGALDVDVTAEDNGAVLHVSQVLMDRYSILVLADFTAPEGTVLDLHTEEDGVVVELGDLSMDFLDKTGGRIDEPGSWSWWSEVLDDGDPLDNHLTFLFTLESSEGIPADLGAAALHVSAVNLLQRNLEARECSTVYSGDWTCDVPLPEHDMGWVQNPNCVVGQMDGTPILLREIYLSPMTLRVMVGPETAPVPNADVFGALSPEESHTYHNWISTLFIDDVITLTGPDGAGVPLKFVSGGKTQDLRFWNVSRLTELTDPAQLRGGTLTLSVLGETYEILLDSLEPADG